MAKYRPIYSKIWADPDFHEYPLEGKLLFVYLCTNPLTSESGIYQLPLKTTAEYTGLSQEKIIELLTTGLKNVYYDVENSYVFIRKFRVYNPGGNPDLIKRSIASDYNQSRQTSLWSLFVREYTDFSSVIPNPKPFNPLTVQQLNPLTVQQLNPKPYLPYHTIQSSLVNKVLKGNIAEKTEKEPTKAEIEIKPTKVGDNGENIKDLTYWMNTLNNSSQNGHDKIAVLVEAFKFICSKAPKNDLSNLGGRLAGIVRHYKNDHSLVLRNMYLCPVYKPDGSWLDYIEKMQISKYGNVSGRVDSKPTKVEIPSPKLTKAKDVIARTQERK